MRFSVEYRYMEKLTIEQQQKIATAKADNSNVIKVKSGCGGCKRAAQRLKELKAKRLADSGKGEIPKRPDGSGINPS